MLIVSRLSVLVFALFAGVWSIILIKIGIDINWLFFVIGLLVASVFPPISFLLTWNAVPKVPPSCACSYLSTRRRWEHCSAMHWYLICQTHDI